MSDQEYEIPSEALSTRIQVEGYNPNRQFPRYIQDKRVPPSANGRPPTGGLKPNMTTATVAATGLTFFALTHGIAGWVKPLLQVTLNQPKSGRIDVLQWIASKVVTWIHPRERAVGSTVSHHAAQAAHGPAQTLNLMAARWNQLLGNLMYFALQVEHDFRTVVVHIIPREVLLKLAPVKLEVGRIKRVSGKTITEVRGLRKYVRTEIDIKLKPEIKKIRRDVTIHLPARITRVETEVKRTTKIQTHDHTLIKLLIPLLTIAGSVAWLTRTLTRAGLKWTTCQNVKDVGNELCNSPPGSGRKLGRWLRDLLGLIPGGLLLSDICLWIGTLSTIARPFLQAIVEVTGTVGAALCNGKYDAAPPLPLHTHALPPSPVGLPL